MGYYKQIDAEQQAELDRVTRWWRDNHEQMPDYVMRRVLADKKLLEDLIEAYELELYRKPIRRQRPAIRDWSMPHREAKTFIVSMAVLWTVAFGLTIALLVL